MAKARARDEVVWIRMGDMSDYESFGEDIDAVAEHLAQFGVRAPFTWFDRGLTVPPFDLPQGHISIYWGPAKEPDFSRNLTAQEQEAIEKAVRAARER